MLTKRSLLSVFVAIALFALMLNLSLGGSSEVRTRAPSQVVMRTATDTRAPRDSTGKLLPRDDGDTKRKGAHDKGEGEGDMLSGVTSSKKSDKSSRRSAHAQLVDLTRDLLMKKVLKECNSDGKNNVGHGSVSCILCEDAIITADEVYCPTKNGVSSSVLGSLLTSEGKEGGGKERTKKSSFLLTKEGLQTNKQTFDVLNGMEKFPPISKGGGTRHHLKVMPIRFGVPASSILSQGIREGPTLVGYYQPPVSGGQFLNVWHTVGDFGLMLYHTMYSLIEYQSRPPVQELLTEIREQDVGGDVTAGDEQEYHRGGGKTGVDGFPLVTWLTRTAYHQFGKELGKACFDEKSCHNLPLFDLIQRLVGGSTQILTQQQSHNKPTRYKFLLLGINTRCSPIPADPPLINIGTCHQHAFYLRQRLLQIYDLPTQKQVTVEEAKCPTIHFMSRQGDKFRWLTPWDDTVKAVRKLYDEELEGCDSEKQVRVLKLSSRVPMRQQVESVANSSILLAGRGGGTTFCLLLPYFGGYLSFSAFDRWNPFRNMYPDWYTTNHVEVGLVHHENPNKGPQVFGKGKQSYVDPNRAAYKVEDAAKFTGALKNLIFKMRQRVGGVNAPSGQIHKGAQGGDVSSLHYWKPSQPHPKDSSPDSHPQSFPIKCPALGRISSLDPMATKEEGDRGEREEDSGHKDVDWCGGGGMKPTTQGDSEV